MEQTIVTSPKQRAEIIKKYSASEYAPRTLDEIYLTYSVNKLNVFNELQAICSQYQGDDMRICGHTDQTFSVIFKGVYNNRDALFYITHSKIRIVIL